MSFLLCHMLLVCGAYLRIMWLFFFFFKQKTAYEMRISDWSSDVCSSDLAEQAAVGAPLLQSPAQGQRPGVGEAPYVLQVGSTGLCAPGEGADQADRKRVV